MSYLLSLSLKLSLWIWKDNKKGLCCIADHDPFLLLIRFQNTDSL